MDNSSFQSVNRGGIMAADITSKNIAAEQANQRSEEMSGDGVSWGVWDYEESGCELFGSHLVTLPGIQNNTSYGPLRLQINDEQLTIFDYGMYLGERQRVLTPILQTVASYRMRSKGAPQFYSRPVANNEAIYSNFLSCFDPVDSATAHSFNQIVESITPRTVVDMLETRTAFVDLLPFLQERGLTVEWTGENLLVYRLGETITRNQIQDFAKEALQIGQFIQTANEESIAALSESLV